MCDVPLRSFLCADPVSYALSIGADDDFAIIGAYAMQGQVVSPIYTSHHQAADSSHRKSFLTAATPESGSRALPRRAEPCFQNPEIA